MSSSNSKRRWWSMDRSIGRGNLNVVRLGCLKAGDLDKFYATPWLPYSLDEDRRNVFASVYRALPPGIS